MTLSLVMIVRDEQQALPACIDSALELGIDHWTIADTGSVDNTKQVIRDRVGHLPGQLLHIPWQGHADARTRVLQAARGTADYHLMLDADLIVEAHLPLPTLTADAYRIRFAGDFRMSLPLLTRDGIDWSYKGAAHSYLVGPANAVYEDLPNIVLHETRSSSPRADKYENDAAALEAELDPRTIHYLAQTYRDLGHAREAADLYRFRVRLSADNPQEVFWSVYQEALLRLETDGLERATPIFLEAWQRRPSRAEPLWKLSREYRLAGQPNIGLIFADQAAQIPMPADTGFVLAWIYEWGALLERALCLRALKRNIEAMATLQTLDQAGHGGEPGDFIRQQIEEISERKAA